MFNSLQIEPGSLKEKKVFDKMILNFIKKLTEILHIKILKNTYWFFLIEILFFFYLKKNTIKLEI